MMKQSEKLKKITEIMGDDFTAELFNSNISIDKCFQYSMLSLYYTQEALLKMRDYTLGGMANVNQ